LGFKEIFLPKLSFRFLRFFMGKRRNHNFGSTNVGQVRAMVGSVPNYLATSCRRQPWRTFDRVDVLKTYGHSWPTGFFVFPETGL
jgi:hypothetical protein